MICCIFEVCGVLILSEVFLNGVSSVTKILLLRLICTQVLKGSMTFRMSSSIFRFKKTRQFQFSSGLVYQSSSSLYLAKQAGRNHNV